MNFPSTQKTGRRAEIALDDHFTSWDWNVGHDHIDIGYDLCVTPDHTQYQGMRFLVQVKGTAVAERRPKASVPKARLRQYARDVLPVFIVRVAKDGVIYWIHAQAWAKTHQDALVGEGSFRVAFEPTQTLSNRTGFETYLQKVVRPLLKAADLLSHSGADRPFNLNRASFEEANPPSEVRLEKTPQGHPEVAANLSFRPLASPENMGRLKDAYQYGLPRSFEVDEFNITPPGLFPALIKPFGPATGTLTMRPLSSEMGTVRMCPGKEYSVLAQELRLAAELFKGVKGVGITNEQQSSPLDLTIRMAVEGSAVKADIVLRIRTATVYGKPLLALHDLAPLAGWAEQVASEDAMLLALEFGSIGKTVCSLINPISGFVPVLQRIRSLSRLHMIARALKSDFSLEEGDTFSQKDFEDIDMAFDLLRGERKAVNLGPMEVEPNDDVVDKICASQQEIFCTTQWQFSAAGKLVGEIPVEIAMPGYVVEPTPGTRKIRVVKGDLGQAWMMHQKHGEIAGRVVRKSD